MYSVPHLISTKGDNKGSCRKYAEYLLKENTMFFNHSSNEISLEEGISFIDENSKNRIKKNKKITEKVENPKIDMTPNLTLASPKQKVLGRKNWLKNWKRATKNR